MSLQDELRRAKAELREVLDKEARLCSKFPCSGCGAQPGQPCRKCGFGPVTRPHAERRRLAGLK